MDDLEAALLEVPQQKRERLYGSGLHVVEQQDSPTRLLDTGQSAFSNLLG